MATTTAVGNSKVLFYRGDISGFNLGDFYNPAVPGDDISTLIGNSNGVTFLGDGVYDTENPPRLQFIDYNRMYLGDILVASRLLRLLDPKGIVLGQLELGRTSTEIAPSTDKEAIVITSDFDTTDKTAVMTARYLAYEGKVASSGYTPSDDDIPTTAAVSEMIGMLTTDYYLRRIEQGTGNNWKTYNFTVGNGTTSLTPLTLTLPVAETISDSGQSNSLPTAEAVRNYFASLAGAMRYQGSMTQPKANGTHSEKYLKGDVFIASETVNFYSTAGTTTGTPTKTAEPGDMVIVNTTVNSNTQVLASNVDIYEKNLDGAVTAGTTFTQAGNVILSASGTNKVSALANPSSGAGRVLSWDSTTGVSWKTAADAIGRYVTSVVQDSTYHDKITVSYNTGSPASVDITINDVTHAANATHAGSLTTSAYTNSTAIPILLKGNNTDSSANYQYVHYASRVTVNGSTGDLTISLQDPTNSSQNVSLSLQESLLWHEITS